VPRPQGVAPDINELYEWSSNVAHPSFGTMLSYGSPMHVPNPGTHSLRLIAGDPSAPELRELRSSREALTESVGGLTIRVAALAASAVILPALDRALMTHEWPELWRGRSAHKSNPVLLQRDRLAVDDGSW
jgi:hypothetical protein